MKRVLRAFALRRKLHVKTLEKEGEDEEEGEEEGGEDEKEGEEEER